MNETKKNNIEDAKEIKDIHDYICKLYFYYKNNMMDKVKQLVDEIMLKYPNETLVWNSCNINMPQNNNEYYNNAIIFLKNLAETKKNDKLIQELKQMKENK